MSLAPRGESPAGATADSEWNTKPPRRRKGQVGVGGWASRASARETPTENEEPLESGARFASKSPGKLAGTGLFRIVHGAARHIKIVQDGLAPIEPLLQILSRRRPLLWNCRLGFLRQRPLFQSFRFWPRPPVVNLSPATGMIFQLGHILRFLLRLICGH
jgi:hypothetical protein